MTEDSPYIVCVKSDDDNVEEYADEEYLDFSSEVDGTESNSEGEPVELLNDVDMLHPEPSFKQRVAPNLQPIPFKWTHAATVQLIEAYQSFETSLVSGQLSMSQVWHEVAKTLQKLGFDVTSQQCKNKFGNLKQIYEKSKEQEINSGVAVKKWIYMDLMEPIMTVMETYKSYSNDSWDSPKCKEVPPNTRAHSQQLTPKQEQPSQGVYKWEHFAILRLIDQYRKYQVALDSGSISQKVLFRLLEKNMQTEGYNVTATQCMVKIHSLKKTYKSIKEYNQVNRLLPRRWKYYDFIDSIVHGTPDASQPDPLIEVSDTLAEIRSEEPTPSHIFKWSRRAIEILVAAYREHRPPLHDTKVSRHDVWQTVAETLHKEGYSVTMAQCRSKISGMLKLYKRKKSGASGRAWTVRGWYSKLIESLVDKPKRPKHVQGSQERRRPESVLDQLIICEENRERRHRENMEQRQQLIDIMAQLLERLS